MQNPIQAPELQVSHWLNTKDNITLAELRGKVVLIEAFQMLCPGCVSNGLPQAMKARKVFRPEDLVVLGLHTVFEHHSAQGTVDALKAFMHEYKIPFPVGIDMAGENTDIPKTMAAYNMRGTPTTILIDRQGYVRKHKFGMEDDMVLGAEILSLVQETTSIAATGPGSEPADCADGTCPAP